MHSLLQGGVLAADIPYWGQSLLRVLGVLVAVLLPAGTIVYLYLFKAVSFMQSRLGPMEAGPYGSMQLFAEVGKFLQKEDLRPDRSDKFIFGIAPIVVLISTFLIYLVIPFGPDAVFADYSTGIFFASTWGWTRSSKHAPRSARWLTIASRR